MMKKYAVRRRGRDSKEAGVGSDKDSKEVLISGRTMLRMRSNRSSATYADP
jgi:hypothetical protein